MDDQRTNFILVGDNPRDVKCLQDFDRVEGSLNIGYYNYHDLSTELFDLHKEKFDIIITHDDDFQLVHDIIEYVFDNKDIR